MELDRETAQAELLAEEVTEDELRELLRRLGQAEFGGSENATVGAIVEATGRDAADIGLILGDIRREEFDRKFGLDLKAHERRIEHLEDVTERIENRPPPALPTYSSDLVSMTEEDVEIMEELVEKRRREKEFQPVAVAVVIIVVLGMLLLLLVGLAQNGLQNPEPKAYRWENGKWVPHPPRR